MQFLMIQNAFEAPIDGFTTLGFSTATEETIGQFGSGSNHSILCCLRAGLDIVVYCGKTRLTFSTKEIVIKEDGLKDRVTKRVTVRKGNVSPRNLDIDLNFGRKDWTNVGMALREFISNAIDRHTKADGWETAMDDGRLQVSLVNEQELRAKSGYTRVYVQVNDEVRSYFANLGQNFFHFSNDPENVYKGLIPRESGPARIYRCGVFVMQVEVEEGTALFDYNFRENEIEIDESRNSNIYVIRAACANKLRESEKEEITIYLKSLAEGHESFESKLEPQQFLSTWSTASDVVQATWAAATKGAFGDAYVVSNSHAKTTVQKKGYEAVLIENSTLVDTLKRLGVITGKDILSVTEQIGIEVAPATYPAEAAACWAWDILFNNDLTFDKDKPGVLCFSKPGDPEMMGYKDGKVIYLPLDVQGDTGRKEALRLTIDYVSPGKKLEVLFDLVVRQETQ